MVRGLRLVAAAAVACASVQVLGVAPAHADALKAVAVNYGYFNSAGIDKPDESPADPPNLTSDHADGVGPGHMAVAANGGTESKVSFLLFDVFAIDPAATVDKAVLRVQLVPTSLPDDLNYNETPEAVQACKAGSEGFAGDDGNGLALAPKRLCEEFKAPGKASSDGKAYEFDVTSLAQEWVAGTNDGVALTVAEGATTNFQVVFDTMETASLDLSYTPAVPETPIGTGGTGTDTLPPPDLGTGFAPTPDTGFAPAPDVVTPDVPNPTVNQPPVAAPPRQVTPVAAVSTSLRPTSGFWLAGFGLLVGLGLLSLVFGDPHVPAAERSTSRLGRALSSRQGLAGAKAGFRSLPA